MSRQGKNRPRAEQSHNSDATTAEPLTTLEPAHEADIPAASLREARQDKGLTLDDLARTTKISLRLLTALEAGDVDRLPAAIFTRGFVKAYAKEVGLDPDKTADLYLSRLAPETLAVDAENARSKVATPVARTGVMAFEEDNARLIKTHQADRFGRLMLLAAVIGLVVYVGPFSWDGWASKVDATADAVPTATTPAPATDGAPAALTAAADVAGGPLQFEMNPQGPCWFSAAADGNRVRSELLQAGDNRTIEVRQELVLRVGDPDACAFSINGRAGRPLGSPGAPVTVRITKDNFREFLSS